MWIASVCMLSTVSFICALGVLSRMYRETLLQNIGLSLISIGLAARAIVVWQSQYVAPESLFTQCGLLVFAIGTALKVRASELDAKSKHRRVSDATKSLWTR